jgi:hypothetical protein
VAETDFPTISKGFAKPSPGRLVSRVSNGYFRGDQCDLLPDQHILHELEIQMTSTDAFALKNSTLNAFLFTEVGTEANGSTLTMLSILARLGQDPWAESARLTKLPRAAAIDAVARSIGAMPLTPQALADARATASRLILLLPAQTKTSAQSISAAVTASAVPNWVPIAFLCASLAVGLAFYMTSAPISSPGVAMPTAGKINYTTMIGSK